MNNKEKARKISEYLNTYPQLYNWLYFNTVTNAPGDMSMLTDSDNKIPPQYIDGSWDKEYIFAVAMVKQYDTGTSDINMEALEETENFIEWVKENNKLEIFPDFGELCNISGMEVVDEVPQLAVDGEQNIARYTVSMKINYTERR